MNLRRIDEYYSEKLRAHGPTPQGVDWNSRESQNLRFEQLTRLIHGSDHFSVLDYGCGYGSLFEYLKGCFRSFDYFGFDISDAMIDEATSKFPDANAGWTNSINDIKSVDYLLASGIFNVKLDERNDAWKKYIYESLQEFDRLSTKGFSFNVLTSYSDREYMKDYLYYANPGEIFDYCKSRFSKYVSLLHDYPLYEFTIMVRKEE